MVLLGRSKSHCSILMISQSYRLCAFLGWMAPSVSTFVDFILLHLVLKLTADAALVERQSPNCTMNHKNTYGHACSSDDMKPDFYEHRSIDIDDQTVSRTTCISEKHQIRLVPTCTQIATYTPPAETLIAGGISSSSELVPHVDYKFGGTSLP